MRAGLDVCDTERRRNTIGGMFDILKGGRELVKECDCEAKNAAARSILRSFQESS